MIKKLEWKESGCVTVEAKGVNCTYYIHRASNNLSDTVRKSIFGAGYEPPVYFHSINSAIGARAWCQEDFEKAVSEFLEEESTDGA